jgi:hypothetical protein
MSIKAKIAAALVLALLMTPDAALAGSNRDCDGPAATQDDDCKAKRDKPKFQTKFFSE